ncbi:MAG: 3'-5' exonuclease [Erysipelotrichaceae bacterium]|nr:3'-5' exonuclease [Erysipelotrichaceae bacterium]
MDPATCYASAKQLRLTSAVRERMKRRFIAFDVETTGMRPDRDRIVELGAVIFDEGMPSEYFSTLVNAETWISPYVTAVNHITNDMIESAPAEPIAFEEFLNFILDGREGKTVFCAHNARFDFGFLTASMNRLGYCAEFEFVDTLPLSRHYLPYLPNYRQGTIEEYLGLHNRDAHRAQSDAEICGEIMCEILRRAEEETK